MLLNRSFFFFFLLFTSLLNAQNIFQKSIAISSNNEFVINNIVHTSDQGFITCGYDSTNNSRVPQIIKYDSSGQVQWSKIISLTSSNYNSLTAYDAIEFTSGGYCVLSSVGDSTSSLFGYLLTKLDINGTIVWNKIYTVNQFLSPYRFPSLSKFNNDDLLITLSITSEAVVIKTDSNGNILWGKSFTFDPNEPKDPSMSSAIGSDGSIMIFSKKNLDLYVIRTTNSGQVLWSKVFEMNRYSYNYCRPYAAKAIHDGTFLVGGLQGYNSFLLKMDTTGNILWHKLIYGPSYFSKIIELPNKKIGLSGPLNALPNIIVTDSIGDLLSSKVIDYNSNAFFQGLNICNAKGNHIGFAGTRSLSSTYSSYIFSMDDTLQLNCKGIFYPNSTFNDTTAINILTGFFENTIGSVANLSATTVNDSAYVTDLCSNSIVQEINNSGLNCKIFPNPLTDHGTIKIETNKLPNNFEFSILDLTGNCVKTIPIRSKLFEFEIQDLSPGIYTYKLSDKYSKECYGKLVIVK